MSDLIRKQDVLDWLKTLISDKYFLDDIIADSMDRAYEYVYDYIEGMAPVDIRSVLEPKYIKDWYSFEEKTPDDYEEVLVWFEYYRYGDYNRHYQTYGLMTYPYTNLINHETGWKDLKLIAWSPLPPRLKEEAPPDYDDEEDEDIEEDENYEDEN